LRSSCCTPFTAFFLATFVGTPLGWAQGLEAQISSAEHAERRAALAAQVGDGILLAMGSAQPPEDYINFYQNSPFRYLTGFVEPNAALVSLVTDGRITAETLFVNPRDPAQETWEGYRVGPEGVAAVTGIAGRSVEDLASVLDSLLANGWGEVNVAGTYDPSLPVLNDVTQRVNGVLAENAGADVRTVDAELEALRGVKSEAEIALLRKAIDITSQAHRELARLVEPGVNEFEGHAVIEYTFRLYGSERPAFATIVGSGPNSTVLHYNANDRFMEAGDVVVADIGASYGGYAADVTRTLPVAGHFTEAQRELYQLVRDAQTAAEEIARPGASVGDMAREAATVLAVGLAELGLIESPGATYDAGGGEEYPQYFLYYMHALSHGIGLDVHDPWPRVMEPGVAFTIEPGIYVRPNLFTEVVPDTPRNRQMQDALLPAFERYVGIGVRIEDDYLITETGIERLSLAPREIDELEALMAEPWSSPDARRPEWVEWYRAFP
jgi:Xaa-Pro aminopeptidase